jgi:Flp pilus assembly protein TadD
MVPDRALGEIVPWGRDLKHSDGMSRPRVLCVSPGDSASESPLFMVPASARSNLCLWGAVALIAIAAGLFYATSLKGEFVYDDLAAIVENETIRRWSWAAVIPPAGVTTSGRPLVNLSFALNYALGGEAVAGYHVFNILIHVAAGLALFGLVRRTLELPALRGRFGAAAPALALSVALLWTLHPLQTESVTYVVQRVESLMGFFYLLTLYCFVRTQTAGAPRLWLGLSVVSCVAGMACKEVMVSAPILVLLLDRGLVAGSFQASWRARSRYYGCLAATWVVLLALVYSTGWNRGGTVGLGVQTGWWEYGLTQFRAITQYLVLSVWPYALTFDYGTFWESSLVAIIPHLLLVGTLLGVAGVALWRSPALGFLAAGFFGPLAPTSLMPGTTQMIVEHRMYLSLAPVMVVLVLAGYKLLGRGVLLVCLVAATALGLSTWQRNRDYETGLRLWRDTVQKVPTNARAHCNLAIALVAAGRLEEATAHYAESLRLEPNSANTRYNHGLSLAKLGRLSEAAAEYEAALKLAPDLAEARCNYGVVLLASGRRAEALRQFQRARELRPKDPDVLGNIGNVLAQEGRLSEALPYYEAALALRAEDADTHFNYANALLTLGRRADAIRHYRWAIRLRPHDRDFLHNLEVALGND